MADKPAPNPLQRLHRRQQQKVATKPQVSQFLSRLADDDHKRIAQLIRKWLEQDQQS